MNDHNVPVGWGRDPVTTYLDGVRSNQFATFANKQSAFADLIEIDGMFRRLLDGAMNPKPLLPASFLLRSHSAYLAALSAVASGQLYEAQSLLRGSLEQAGYGCFIGNNQERWELWMNRHDSPDSLKSVRREFTHGKIVQHLTSADVSIAEIYAKLYDWTIDYGAHPNERGASMSSAIRDLPDGAKQIQAIYLYDDGLLMDFCLRETAQVGLCDLRIACLIYPARTKAVGIEYQLQEICKRY